MAQIKYMINHILTVLSHQYKEILLYISLRFCPPMWAPINLCSLLKRELSYAKNLNGVAESIKVCRPLS
jgi:hypothetical protein